MDGSVHELKTEEVHGPEELEPLPSPAHENKLLTIVRLWWQARRTIGRIALAGMVLGIIIAVVTPNRYESTTRLMPPDSQMSGALGIMGALAQGGGGAAAQISDLLPMKSSGALFLGVLRSRTVQDRLVKGFDLTKVYGKKLAVDARKQLQDNTTITEDRRSGIISISVTDRDPKRAAALCDAYVQELDRLVMEVNTSAAHRERVFLQTRLREVKQELDGASKQLGEFSSKNATLNISDQAKAMVEAAAVLQGQLIAAESELRGLQEIYTDQNVRVRSVQARVAELRNQLNKMGGVPPRPGESGDSSDLLYPSLRQLPILGLTYADLYRNVKVQEAVFEALTKQYELAKVEEVKEVPSVRVLDPADVPERKSEPHRTILVLVSTFLALVAGAAYMWMRTAWQAVDDSDAAKAFVTDIFRNFRPGLLLWHVGGRDVAHLRQRLNRRHNSNIDENVHE